MTNNGYILRFKKKAFQQLKNKNFTNNQRLPFYQALTKIANETVQSLDNQNDKNDMPVYKKILSQLKEPHSLKNNIKRWFKSFQNELSG